MLLSLLLVLPSAAIGQRLSPSFAYTAFYYDAAGRQYFATTNLAATEDMVHRLQAIREGGPRSAKELDNLITSAINESSFATHAERTAFLINAASVVQKLCPHWGERNELEARLMWQGLNAPEAKALPPTILAWLVSGIRDVPPQLLPPGADPMPVVRRVRTEWMLYALQQADQAVDETYDPFAPKNMPGTAVPPGGGIAGMSARHIADPILRAKYEEAQRVERSKAERSLLESERRGVQASTHQTVCTFVANAYSVRPYDPEGLAKLVRAHVARPEVQAVLIQAGNEFLPSNWQKYAYQGEYDHLEPRSPRPFRPAPVAQPLGGDSGNLPAIARKSARAIGGKVGQQMNRNSVVQDQRGSSESAAPPASLATGGVASVWLWLFGGSITLIALVLWRAQVRRASEGPK